MIHSINYDQVYQARVLVIVTNSTNFIWERWKQEWSVHIQELWLALRIATTFLFTLLFSLIRAIKSTANDSRHQFFQSLVISSLCNKKPKKKFKMFYFDLLKVPKIKKKMESVSNLLCSHCYCYCPPPERRNRLYAHYLYIFSFIWYFFTCIGSASVCIHVCWVYGTRLMSLFNEKFLNSVAQKW